MFIIVGDEIRQLPEEPIPNNEEKITETTVSTEAIEVIKSTEAEKTQEPQNITSIVEEEEMKKNKVVCNNCRKKISKNELTLKIRTLYGNAVDSFYCPFCKKRSYIITDQFTLNLLKYIAENINT